MKNVLFQMTDHTFSDAVKRNVGEYFSSHNLEKKGNWELYAKAILFIPLAFGIYLYILLGHYSQMTGILLYIALGACFSMVAVNVMHDACHGSFSEKKWVNDVMGLTMNAIGSNAYLWKIRHTVHHTFTNIEGMDYDIDNWPMLRQSPTQGWKPVHRYQYLYMFPIYALSTIEWMLVSDFTKYFSRKVSSTRIQKIRLPDHLVFWGSKAICVITYIVIPVWFLGWQNWLIGFCIVHFIMGLSLTIIFQLAHLVENTHFEEAEKDVKQISSEWAVHQVVTTSNFATDNKILSWCAGGLNFQIEHHLFPFVSHIHYPAISEMIRNECSRHNLPYHCYPTLGKAFISHIHFMKKLGMKPCQ
ncbi:MAG: acyl-CoA desaturase [Saprospiraceae bacterium]